MSEEQEQLFYEMKQYLVQHSQKWNTLCDIEQLIIDKDKEIERLNNIINKMMNFIEHEAILRDSCYGEEYYFRDLFPDYYQDLLNIIKGSE